MCQVLSYAHDLTLRPLYQTQFFPFSLPGDLMQYRGISGFLCPQDLMLSLGMSGLRPNEALKRYAGTWNDKC